MLDQLVPLLCGRGLGVAGLECLLRRLARPRFCRGVLAGPDVAHLLGPDHRQGVVARRLRQHVGRAGLASPDLAHLLQGVQLGGDGPRPRLVVDRLIGRTLQPFGRRQVAIALQHALIGQALDHLPRRVGRRQRAHQGVSAVVPEGLSHHLGMDAAGLAGHAPGGERAPQRVGLGAVHVAQHRRV